MQLKTAKHKKIQGMSISVLNNESEEGEYGDVGEDEG